MLKSTFKLTVKSVLLRPQGMHPNVPPLAPLATPLAVCPANYDLLNEPTKDFKTLNS